MISTDAGTAQHLDIFQRKDGTRENGFLDSCGSAHFVSKQESEWFGAKVPVTDSKMERTVE
jgi:hypothetical protein